MKKLLYLIVFSLLAIGCDNELSDLDHPIKSESPDTPLTRALQNAEDFFSSIGETRSESRVPREIIPITGHLNGSTTSLDTLLYVVNYAHDKGYAILGATPPSNGIYAISESGNITQEDMEDPIMAGFLYEAKRDAMTAPLVIPIDPPVYPDTIQTETEYVNMSRVGPLLSKKSSAWGQLGVFSRYTPESYPGCFPVATLMLLNYFQWPQQLSGTTINWQAMEDNNLLVARVLRLLGEDYFNAQYTDKGAYVYPQAILPGFQALQYDIDNTYFGVAFNPDRARNMIIGASASPRQPVMVMGYRATENGTVGHAFIIDGYVNRVKNLYKDGKKVSGPLPADPLYHIVWGWEGRYNGYFVYNLIRNVFQDKVECEKYNDGRDDDMILTDTQYYTSLKMYTGISPQK